MKLGKQITSTGYQNFKFEKKKGPIKISETSGLHC